MVSISDGKMAAMDDIFPMRERSYGSRGIDDEIEHPRA